MWTSALRWQMKSFFDIICTSLCLAEMSKRRVITEDDPAAAEPGRTASQWSHHGFWPQTKRGVTTVSSVVASVSRALCSFFEITEAAYDTKNIPIHNSILAQTFPDVKCSGNSSLMSLWGLVGSGEALHTVQTEKSSRDKAK